MPTHGDPINADDPAGLLVKGVGRSLALLDLYSGEPLCDRSDEMLRCRILRAGQALRRTGMMRLALPP